MKRDPIQTIKSSYFKNIRIKEIKPRFFWHACKCCGQEFKGEHIYKCIEPSLVFTWEYIHIGCMNCFHSKEHFRQWLIENEFLLNDDDFENKKKLQKLMK